jgi:hypothetical protein
MKKIASAPICAVVAASVMLSACAQMPRNLGNPNASSGPLTPAQTEMEKSSTDFGVTVAQGAALGAGAGSLLGLGFGGTSGMLIGLASGLVAGSLAGYYVADQKEQYAKMEDQLDVLVADLKGQNQKLAQMVTSSEKMVAVEKQNLEAINAEYKAGKATKEQVAAQIKEANTSKALIEKSISQVDERRAKLVQNINKYKSSHASPDPEKVAAYDAEFSNYKQGRSSLETNLSSLDALVASINLDRS